MIRCLNIIAVFVTVISSSAAAFVELSNERVITDAARIIRPNRRADFSARLSPDGKYLLFPRQMREDVYRMILLNIETKSEYEIEIDLPSGYDTVFTRYNFFSPKGDKLAMFSIEEQSDAASRAVRVVSEISILDISTKILTASGITGGQVMAQFDYTGKRLVVSGANSTVALAGLDDFKLGESITSGWVHSCSPHSPFATIFVALVFAGDMEVTFKLLNLETKELAELPVHPENSGLDDITSHWSSDGRYVFYFDYVNKDSEERIRGNRVWDVNENKEKAVIKNVHCLGPGPADNLMIMVATEVSDSDNNLRVYNLETGELSPIGNGSIKGIHAWGKLIMYSKTENGKDNICIAEIAERRY